MKALKALPARDWNEIVEIWYNHIPDDIFGTVKSNNIDQFLRLNNVELEDKKEIELIPHLREYSFSLSLFLRLKSLYCINTAKEMNSQGFPTWAALLMYDSCFFSAKAICHLLGVIDTGRDSKFYIDIFHTDILEKKKIDGGHKIYKFKERLSHSMLWGIFGRLLNTFKGYKEAQLLLSDLKKIKYDKFSRERNRLIYNSDSWSREDEIEISDLFEPRHYQKNLDFIDSPMEIQSEYHHQYNYSAILMISFLDCLINDLICKIPSVKDMIKGTCNVPYIDNI